MKNRRVLTFQDLSCLGRCSLSVVLPVISACGIETVILPSAILSTHTGGFSRPFKKDLTEDIPSVLDHWKKEGERFDCIYTGYLADSRQIHIAEELKENFLTEDGCMIVDPVMADHGKLYSGFDESFIKEMAELCAAADIVMPNITEAALLTGNLYQADHHTEKYVRKLLLGMASLGPGHIILKGIDSEDGKIRTAIYDQKTGHTESASVQREPRSFHGTGDLFAAAFTGAYMREKSMAGAAGIASEFVRCAIEKTPAGAPERNGVVFERALPVLMHLLGDL